MHVCANHDNHQSIGGPKVPQAHTRHHRHLELAELVWSACLEAADVPYALTLLLRISLRVLLPTFNDDVTMEAADVPYALTADVSRCARRRIPEFPSSWNRNTEQMRLRRTGC
eukprot:COSAG02_NODE_1711_length_11223_cov_5.622348_5_plen_113_part_00